MRRRESQLRVKGVGLKTRFVIAMTAALTLVMAAASYALHATATRIAHNVQTSTISFQQPKRIQSIEQLAQDDAVVDLELPLPPNIRFTP